MSARLSIIIPAAVLLLFASATGVAASQGIIKATVVVEKEIEVVNEEGEKEIQRVEAETVIPGDEVIYTISYRNEGDESAEALVITNPIPEHMIYTRAAPFKEEAVVTFSIDDGSTYDIPERLVVVDADGAKRRATSEDYTHIRWVFDQPLPPGMGGEVSFRAQLQ